MTNYIPNYDKKRKLLVRRELDLRRAIQRGASRDRLLAAAERVRLARVGVLKSNRANPPVEYREHPGRYAEAGAKIQALLEMSAEAILAEFGVDVPEDDGAR